MLKTKKLLEQEEWICVWKDSSISHIPNPWDFGYIKDEIGTTFQMSGTSFLKHYKDERGEYLKVEIHIFKRKPYTQSIWRKKYY